LVPPGFLSEWVTGQHSTYCNEEGRIISSVPWMSNNRMSGHLLVPLHLHSSYVMIFIKWSWYMNFASSRSHNFSSSHSVLNRTPMHLIQEIILVDDFSNDRKYH
jgi:hypothetical protein